MANVNTNRRVEYDMTSIRSLRSDNPVKIQFTSQHRNVLQMHWIDFDKQPRDVGLLFPGANVEFGTFTTHVWTFTDALTGEIVFVAITPAEFHHFKVGFCEARLRIGVHPSEATDTAEYCIDALKHCARAGWGLRAFSEDPISLVNSACASSGTRFIDCEFMPNRESIGDLSRLPEALQEYKEEGWRRLEDFDSRPLRQRIAEEFVQRHNGVNPFEKHECELCNQWEDRCVVRNVDPENEIHIFSVEYTADDGFGQETYIGQVAPLEEHSITASGTASAVLYYTTNHAREFVMSLHVLLNSHSSDSEGNVFECKGSSPKLMRVRRGEKRVFGESEEDNINIVQGQIGNCWFLQVATVLGLVEHSAHLESMISPKTVNPHGAYSVRLLFYGEPVYVLVDDCFPFYRGGVALYGHHRCHSAFWISILEKAVAKISGGYTQLQGGLQYPTFSPSSFACSLYGGVPKDIPFHDDDIEVDYEEMWRTMKMAQFRRNGHAMIIACTSRYNGGADSEGKNGLVGYHGYSLLKVLEIRTETKQTLRLLKIRNPWGRRGTSPSFWLTE